MHAKKIIAFIPARGGSKRIPNKNRKPLDGKPIVLHVIEILKSIEWIDTICVSTDDQEIITVSENAGAICLGFRDESLSNDFCGFKELLKQDIFRFEKHLQLSKDYCVLFVLPTAALINQDILNEAKVKYFQSGYRFLFSAREYDISPFWAFTIKDDNITALFPEKLNERSQDLPLTFSDAGLFYFIDHSVINSEDDNWFQTQDKTYFLSPANIAIDVDTPEDWELLEFHYHQLKRN